MDGIGALLLHKFSKSSFGVINVAVFVTAIGYGITFPLLAFRMERLGISGFWIGVNAAMPALGWIVGSSLAPRLQAILGIRMLTIAFASMAVVALVGTAGTSEYWTSTCLRLFLGGGAGMFFRSIEYWINGLSADAERGRRLATYNFVYVLGLVVGTLIQPELGIDGWQVFAPAIAAFLCGLFVLAIWPRLDVPSVGLTSNRSALSIALIAAAPAPFLAILAYGLYEAIPIYVMPIYALRNGLGDSISAYTVTAATIGNLIFPLPLAMASDRLGRRPLLMFCALTVILMSAALPFAVETPKLFLLLICVWAGFAGSIYSISLAMLGDHFGGNDLILANASFGIVYASGSLIGPFINGAAIDTLQTHGVMVSAAAIFAMLMVLLTIDRLGCGARRAA